MPSGSKPPKWKLDSVYTGFDSDQYSADRKELLKVSKALVRGLKNTKARDADAGKWLAAVLKKTDRAYALYNNLESYCYCRYAANTQDKETLAQLNGLEEDVLVLKSAEVLLRNGLNSIRDKLPGLITSNKTCGRFQFFLEEQLHLQSRQMSPEEENLASDLSRAGADAWGRLQEQISSTLDMPWEGDERKTVVELRSLATDPDRTTREKAYEKELAAWKSMEIPLAAALNGVKGFAVTLDERRHYKSSLDHAATLSRITQKTLTALTGVMEKNLPVFRKYLKAKAKLLGVKRCAFYDLYAPVGDTTAEWNYSNARSFITDQFSGFSGELGAFAKTAFGQGWIDALSRSGKVGGAFCTFMPLAKESRILANFDGSFDSVATLAHELGHGYHGSVLKDLSALHQEYPMTLAETASIFCETIIFNRALEHADHPGERIGILETFLQGATAVIVDILSRFNFESAVFERRKNRELSPGEFSELMLQAQLDTYGDGLDRKKLHPYMWAVKSHYYSADLSFYNYPYAFGQLLGLALYANYETQPDGFPERYRRLLELTGRATAEQVTREAGFNIEREEFWQNGIDVISRRVDEFARLVRTAVA